MATIPIHQPADCGVTKPLRREPHAACRPIDTTLYHASIDDGSLSLFLFFISLFFSSRSSMTGFAWFFLTRTSQSTTSHTHTHSHTQKRVNRHRFSRLKRHFLFFFFFSKGFEYEKPFNVHRALSLSFFSFDSFVYMCVCLLCVDGARMANSSRTHFSLLFLYTPLYSPF